MFQEAVAVDKHNQSYRGLLKQAKLELAKATKAAILFHNPQSQGKVSA